LVHYEGKGLGVGRKGLVRGFWAILLGPKFRRGFLGLKTRKNFFGLFPFF